MILSSFRSFVCFCFGLLHFGFKHLLISALIHPLYHFESSADSYYIHFYSSFNMEFITIYSRFISI